MSAFPNASPIDIKDFLLGRTIDLGKSGPDNQFGYGRLWLGDVPSQVFQPSATPVDEQSLPVVTQAALPAVTLPATLEAEPVIEPTPTRTPENEKETSWLWLAGLLLCVVLPGFLGIMGIGIVLMIWLSQRKKSAQGKPAPVRPAPAFCIHCGQKLRPESKFCPNCGKSVH
jgi:hypothetical protein